MNKQGDDPKASTSRRKFLKRTGTAVAGTVLASAMAAESGKLITWEDALASNLELAPGLDQFTMDSEAPVQPDSEGRYPIAMPGFTKVL